MRSYRASGLVASRYQRSFCASCSCSPNTRSSSRSTFRYSGLAVGGAATSSSSSSSGSFLRNRPRYCAATSRWSSAESRGTSCMGHSRCCSRSRHSPGMTESTRRTPAGVCQGSQRRSRPSASTWFSPSMTITTGSLCPAVARASGSFSSSSSRSAGISSSQVPHSLRVCNRRRIICHGSALSAVLPR